MDKLELYIERLQEKLIDELLEVKEEFGEPTDDDYLVASIHSHIEGEQTGLRKVQKYIENRKQSQLAKESK